MPPAAVPFPLARADAEAAAAALLAAVVACAKAEAVEPEPAMSCMQGQALLRCLLRALRPMVCFALGLPCDKQTVARSGMKQAVMIGLGRMNVACRGMCQ